METQTSCPVCKEPVEAQQILRCGHQFCTPCLNLHIEKSSRNGKFHCPSCREECEVPVDDEMTEQDQTQNHHPPNTKHPEHLPCFNSGHGQAYVVCLDCGEFFCSNCTAAHKYIPQTRGHKMKRLEKMSADEIANAKSACLKDQCIEHEQPLTITCKTCHHKLICTTCIAFDHKPHFYKEVSKSGLEIQKELDHIVLETGAYIVKQTQGLSSAKGTKENVRRSLEAARKLVIDTVQRLRDIINKHEADFLITIDSYEKEALGKLESIEKSTLLNQDAASRLKQDAENLRSSGQAIDRVRRAPAIQEQFDTRNNMEQSMTWTLDLVRNELTEQSLKNMLGTAQLRLETEKTHATISLREPTLQVALQGSSFVTGIVVIHDYILVTHFQDQRVWMYDFSKNTTKTLKIPQLEAPYGMALLSTADHLVVITDQNSDGGRLHFLKISSDLDISYHRVTSIPVKRPRRISVSHKTGRLLIGQQGSPQFVICNEEGDVVKSVTVADEGSECFPFSVVETDEDKFAVLMHDKGFPRYIKWTDSFNRDGATYGCKENEQIERSFHMVSDSKGRLIVVDDGNDKLHLVGSGGHLLQFLLTKDDDIHRPEYVYLDEPSRRLYLAHGPCGSREIRSYRWPHNPGDCHTSNYQLQLTLPQI